MTLANEVEADLFLSIHNNASNKPEINGTETFYFKNLNDLRGKNIATILQNSIIQTLAMKDRKTKADTGYYVLKNTKMPAVLLEVGFLSNAQDRAKLTQPNFSWNLAQIIYNGISQHFQDPNNLN